MEMVATGTPSKVKAKGIYSAPRADCAPASRNMLVLVGLLLAAIVSIYFTTYETMFLREKSVTSGSLETYGIDLFSCDSKVDIGSIGITKADEVAEVGPTARPEASILIRPRPYFPLLGNTQSANNALSNTKYSASTAECYNDCRHFVPNAGHCLLSTAAPADLLYGSSPPSSRKTDSNAHVGIRCLPSFLIVGAMKAGTGVLMSSLNQHPLLQSGHGVGGKNEVHFFGSAAAKALSLKQEIPLATAAATATSSAAASAGANDLATRTCPWVQYALHFPPSKGIYTFDKSPDILRVPEAHAQMAAMLPSAKLLVLLRDPSTRAVSAFDHHCRHGRYVRLSRSMCLRTASAQSVQDGEGGKASVSVSFPKGTVVRLDWLVDSASNVKMGVKERTQSSAFGLAHKYSPLGNEPGCLALAACTDTNSTAKAHSACPAVSYKTLKQYFSQIQYPCQPSDLEDYYYGTGSAELKSHSSAELTHGMYAEQLKSLLKYYPAAQLQILFQENMIKDMHTVLDNIQGFLGVPRHDLVMEGARHGLSLRGGSDDTQDTGNNKAVLKGVKELLRDAVKAFKRVWKNARDSASDEAVATADDNDNTDNYLSSSARLQASLSPATKALLVASYGRANAELKALLQELPEVAHYTGRELPDSWAL